MTRHVHLSAETTQEIPPVVHRLRGDHVHVWSTDPLLIGGVLATRWHCEQAGDDTEDVVTVQPPPVRDRRLLARIRDALRRI